MKKQIITLATFLIGISSFATAQNVDQQIIVTSGDDVERGAVHLSWTLGQLIGSTSEVNGIYLTEGFHQTSPSVILSSLPELAQSISIYPNPVLDHVSIAASDVLGVGYYTITNVSGQILESSDQVNFAVQKQISFYQFSTGIYYLTLYIDGEATQFKIIKS